ncbi:MAG: nicotinate-nucleotide adenylyltransferase [Methylococcales bacterium]|nr:nicotinate-nucleotide adenylyltransferase [Methylococcales bacterium]
MIGIYGGTFNPIHYGHLRTALEIKEILNLSEIRFIPCAQPALKDQPLVSAKARFEMVQLAIEAQAGFKGDDRELERQGVSYMVDTLASLRVSFPQQPLVLLLGMDAFEQLTQWSRWQRVFDYAHIVVMSRPKNPQRVLTDFFKQRLIKDSALLKQHTCGKLYFQKVTPLAISSTAIRKLFAQEKSPRFLMPDNVIDYIQQHKIYRNLNASQ